VPFGAVSVRPSLIDVPGAPRARRFLAGFEVEFFASLRLVADLADNEKVMAVISGGVVERQFDRHQKDQLVPWVAGELLPWWLERRAIEANARHRQRLIPASKHVAQLTAAARAARRACAATTTATHGARPAARRSRAALIGTICGLPRTPTTKVNV
jgi:hypothetical protein